MITGEKIDPRAREFFNYRTKTQRRRSEADWEEGFIRTLKRLGGKFRKDLQREGETKEHLLEKNLLFQLERLYERKHNLERFRFSLEEANKLLQELYLSNLRDLEQPILLITKERSLEIPLIDRNNIDNNSFEVVQQAEEWRKRRFTHIYDLVLLVNGLPLVCIELKKATISNTEAFEQLKRYERDRLLTKPLGIFNNFQLFIATNFQRVNCFGKRDIQDLESLDRLTMHRCKSEGFSYLNYLDRYFEPKSIIRQLFEIHTNLEQKFNKPLESILPAIERKRRDVQVNPGSFNIGAEAIVCLFLVCCFFLINCLGGGQWGTILISLLALGGGYGKRVWLYKGSNKFLKMFKGVKQG